MEHDGQALKALWVFNDTPQSYSGVRFEWKESRDKLEDLNYEKIIDIPANQSHKVMELLTIRKGRSNKPSHVELSLTAADGALLARNCYNHPFQPTPRPKGYPWKFDRRLGMKVFDRPGAPSMANASGNMIFRLVPLRVKEEVAEWALRQKLPVWLVSRVARIVDRFNT